MNPSRANHSKRNRAAALAVFAFVLRAAFVMIVAASPVVCGAAASSIPIVLGPAPSAVERTAADELATLLARMHSGQEFPLRDTLPASSPAILLGTRASHPALAALLRADDAKAPGSFVVRSVPADSRTLVAIAGADPRAALHAVYGLLEERGCGFYLSSNRIPERGAAFDPTGLDLADAPHVADRIVFNWHNFLSGCSTWDLADWEMWIRQAARMRYSAIMVHAYGNNPMFCFSHNGLTKPVGWLTTTAKGRDNGTQHVNDVRRLVGGDVFDGPVFGSRAALVPDGRRVAAAKDLMRQVFASAKDWGMDVMFAFDVDSDVSNPPDLIGTLPAEARFKNGSLPNPDTPEGYAYYKAQVDTLLADYPQIDRIVVWFRGSRTPWRNLSADDLPGAWRAAFDEAIDKEPALARDKGAPCMFAISRIVHAFRRILDDGGDQRVKLDIGTWNFHHMRAADAFMPRETTFLGLDYEILFGTPEVRDIHRAVSANRPVIPLVWAHHDDRTYIGRPYTPFAGFASELDACGASGFGIIHWTTRPLDLYFRSLSEQTWTRTLDLPRAETCARAASRLFGPAQAGPLGAYLDRWLTEAPQFGRETSDRFIDEPLECDEVVAAARERLRLLDRIPAASLDPEGRGHLAYFQLLERFHVAFHEAHDALQESRGRFAAGDLAGAREAIRAARPEEAIACYRDAAHQGDMTRGEQGILVSLNLRWLPDFHDQQEAVGLRPVRVNFQPTRHDPLARGPGRHTFFVDADGAMWRGLGARETGMETFARTDAGEKTTQDPRHEIAATGIRCAVPYTYTSPELPPGRYRVRMLMADPAADTAGRCVFNVAVASETREGDDAAAPAASTDSRIDLFRDAGGRGALLERAIAVELPGKSPVRISLTPVAGPAVLCGLIIEPNHP